MNCFGKVSCTQGTAAPLDFSFYLGKETWVDLEEGSTVGLVGEGNGLKIEGRF